MSDILFVGASGINFFFEKISIFENQDNNVISPIIKNLLKKVNEIDLILIKLKLQEELHWNDERINNAITEYYKLLIMIKLKVKIVTTNDINIIWSMHSNTKQYNDDCNNFFGYYLHYENNTINNNNNNDEIQQNMLKMYKLYFCQNLIFK